MLSRVKKAGARRNKKCNAHDATACLIETLTAGLPDPVIVVTRKTCVMMYNDPVRDLFEGIEKGKPLSHTTRDSELLEALSIAMRDNVKTSVTFALKKPRKSTVSATLVPLHASLDAICTDQPAVLIHMRDMSEQERLASMRMHFIANASHELRTPLSSLLGFVETLQTTARNDPEARKRFLDIMGIQARRMSRLINDLLSLTRLEMNPDPPPDMPVNIADTVLGIIDLLRPVAGENNVELIPLLPPEIRDNPPFVRGERDELEQVIQNIVHNAIRYGGEGGKVWVELARIAPARRHGPRISIKIRDKGRGIAKIHIPHLTERFYRVDKVISRNKGGTGLGLAIAKHIIGRHRGKLAVKSKPGKGSTFTVFLPENPPKT